MTLFDIKNIHLKIIDYGTKDYEEAVFLREEILRKPFGHCFSKEELNVEKDHIHISGFYKNEIVASCALVVLGSDYKIRRVCVKNSMQNIGIGSLDLLRK